MQLCLNRGSSVYRTTGPDDAVAESSANGLVGTGFTSRYRLQPQSGFLKPQWVGVRPLDHLLFH